MEGVTEKESRLYAIFWKVNPDFLAFWEGQVFWGFLEVGERGPLDFLMEKIGQCILSDTRVYLFGYGA